MATKAKKKSGSISSQTSVTPGKTTQKKESLLLWVIAIIVITAVCFFPMLKNQFTNWDDDFYVTGNALLRDPDWVGIFTKSVVGNYHPLTVITLAINYQLSGLDPFSYLVFNYLLHAANAALVFYFIYLITNKKTWIAFFVALVFAIHPMHVESVAWVAERKDVLYTLFFILSLVQYWKFLQSGRKTNYWFCFLFFILSVLSKPAAVILPLTLFLLDYWKSRPLKKPVVFEKIPFLLVSLVFGIITINIQSSTAITGLESFPLWMRLFFACYVLMIYFLRFFVPYPLSAFHPYPPAGDLGFAVYISPVFILTLIAACWFLRKNKSFTFGISFFAVNLLLVLQLITIGSTIVSERYTYVPYIGMAFILASWFDSKSKHKSTRWLLPAAISLAFGFISFQRTAVWRNNETLWADAIEKFPNSAVPRNQRAIYYAQLSDEAANKNQADELLQKALEDCNVALKSKPDYINALENRQHINVNLFHNEEALADAEVLVKLAPGNYRGYYTKGLVYARLNEPAKAIPELKRSVTLNPSLDNAINLLGSILVNNYQDYQGALANFNKAISLNPQGIYYLNRSVCYYRMGNMVKAKEDAQIALQKRTAVPENFRKALNL